MKLRHLSGAIACAFAIGAVAGLISRPESDSVGRPGTGTSDDRDMIAYMQSIKAEALAAHVGFLASDDLQGRYVGTPGILEAERYIANRYRSLGAQPVDDTHGYLQPFEIFHERPNSIVFKVRQRGEDVLSTEFSLEPSNPEAFPASDAIATGSFPVAFAGYGIDDDTLGYSDYRALREGLVDVGGKWLLILANEPSTDSDASTLWKGGVGPTAWTTRQLSAKRTAAMDAGKDVGLLIVNDLDKGALPFDQQSAAASSNWKFSAAPMMLERNPAPSTITKFVYVTSKFADALLMNTGHTIAELRRQIVSSGHPVVFDIPDAELDVKAIRDRPPVKAENVVAVIEGSDPDLKDQFVIVTSHYDHNGTNPALSGDNVFNGAADDASGVAATLEIAAAFARAKADGHGPRRSILFLNTSAEERGVLGSAFFADREPLVPMDHVVADVNLDGVGGSDRTHPDGNYIYLVQSEVLGGGFAKLVGDVQQAAGSNVAIVTDQDFDSDHRSFSSYLVPVAYFSTGFTDHYHLVSDQADTIDYEDMQAVTRLVFGTVWRLANTTQIVQADRASLAGLIGYKCPPCIRPHDEHIRDKPGYCPTCLMRLVPVLKE